MSTYLYLSCLDHVPFGNATEESGQHIYDLPRIRGQLKHREELTTSDLDADLGWDVTDGDRYFTRNTQQFLKDHPNCRIGIVDEYCRWYDTTGNSTDPLDAPPERFSAEQVDRSAEALRQAMRESDGQGWDALTEHSRNEYRKWARAALYASTTEVSVDAR